jgi:thymidylate synthase (FAD)
MINLLDHGYLKQIETWGSDERIVEAARMSTGKDFLGWGGAPCLECAKAKRLVGPDHRFRSWEHTNNATANCSCKGTGKTTGDEKLLRYLWENKHATPFEMAGLVIEVQAPIEVFRQWHRHRTQSYNEMSARYVPLPDMNYVPSVERLMMGAGGTNKQAGAIKGAEALTIDRAEKFRTALAEMYIAQETLYQMALGAGVPKELARVHLPVGRYSRMRASANLRNWLAFLTLRMDEHAQWEIRMYANAVGALIAEAFPRTWALFKGSV